MKLTVLAGGYGGAKMSHGFALAAAASSPVVASPLELSVVVNTGDDMELHGLLISPDLDTVMYTLAGLANTETGWGVRDETWSGADMLARYGATTWFRLGDRDLATHLLRTEALRRGERLTEITARLSANLGVSAALLPMTDDAVRTRVRTDAGWLDFQDYFVRRGHRDAVRELAFEGIEAARPSPEALRAIRSADLVVLAPSNPFVSVGPILGLKGVLEALSRPGRPLFAVSPIVGGAALRGPADRMFESLGGEVSALGVARHYAERYPSLVDALVIDTVDAPLARPIEALGMRALISDTVMRDDEDRRRLAEVILDSAATPVSARA